MIYMCALYMSLGCEAHPYYMHTTVDLLGYDGAMQSTVTCIMGHRYPDGYVSKLITCRDGQWIPEDLEPCLGMHHIL